MLIAVDLEQTVIQSLQQLTIQDIPGQLDLNRMNSRVPDLMPIKIAKQVRIWSTHVARQ